MSVPEIATGVLLLLQSIVVLACLLTALPLRFRRRGVANPDDQSFGSARMADLHRLARLALSKPQHIAMGLRAAKDRARLHKDVDGLGTVLDHVLNGGSSAFGVETVIGQVLSREDKGAIGICTLLTKSGPLAGLAGMLVGVSQALSQYLNSGCSPQTFIAGFAVSIMATFWGVMIALMALFTARGLWLPHLARLRQRLLEQTAVATDLVAEIRDQKAAYEHRKVKPETGPPAKAIDTVMEQPLHSLAPSPNGEQQQCTNTT